MRKLPPKRRRPRGPRKTAGSVWTTEGVQAPQRREIDLPEIFVKVFSPDSNWKSHFAQARIVLRRRVYRYLVWKANGRKKMLYLGKIKISALLPATSAADLAPASSRSKGGQE